ncbi:MAG TPA: ABC transporter permease, partial [Lachnospiraceae bacterium]|nr:ABC transporter permease [Lachnospiraceae bacterium]
LTEWIDKYDNLVIIILCTLLVKFILDWYLKTKSGLLLRAAGDNPVMVTTIAKNNGYVKIIGLMLCNGLAATAGSILCQQQKYFDSTMGQGMMVMGLASVIIGITILGRVPLIKATSMVIIGSILYKACLSIAISIGVDPLNLKLLMTIIFLIALSSNNALRKRRFQKNA